MCPIDEFVSSLSAANRMGMRGDNAQEQPVHECADVRISADGKWHKTSEMMREANKNGRVIRSTKFIKNMTNDKGCHGKRVHEHQN